MLTFQEGKTLFHNLDPISKFGWLTLTTIWLLSMEDILSVIIGCSWITIVVVLCAGMNPLRYAKMLSLILFGGLNLVLFQGIFREGYGIEIAWLHLSYSGLAMGAVLTFRSIGIVLCSIAFSKTTNPKLVALSLVKMGMPYKYAHVAYLGLRFIPMVESDFGVIMDTLRLRGIQNGWQKIRMAIVALVATEIRRTEEIAIALETRGFGIYPTRIDLDEVNITKKGFFIFGLTLVIIILDLVISPHYM